MRTTASDIRHYFHKLLKIRVNDVIFLKHPGNHSTHRGMAYVELRHKRDVPRAIELAHLKVPDWQRFPIQIRTTEADGTLHIQDSTATTSNTAISNGTTSTVPAPVHVDVQQAYIGNIERVVTTEQLHYLFSQFGSVTKVALQIDPVTNLSKGFAFISYTDATHANLAIQTMQGQLLAGRPM